MSTIQLVARIYAKFQEDGKAYKQANMVDNFNSLRDKPLHGQFLLNMKSLIIDSKTLTATKVS